MNYSSKLTVWVLGALAAGCVGEADLPPRQVMTPSGTMIECDRSPAPSPVVMRRLTNEEHANTLRTLLGVSDDVAASLPPDSLVYSFDNNAEANTVSTARATAYQGIAETLAAKVVADANLRGTVVGCNPAGAERASCLKSFIERFGRRAFRRALSAEEVADLTALAETTAGDADVYAGARLVITALLQSPSFVFRPEVGGESAGRNVTKLTGYERASRLSYLFFKDTPDEALLSAAEQGKLDNDEELANYAMELFADERGKAGLQSFTDQWLQLRNVGAVPPSTSVYPAWTPSLGASMVEQTRRFVRDLATRDGANFLELIHGTTTEVNAELAKLYGVPAPAGDTWAKVTMDPKTTQRTGLLGQASFLTVSSRPDHVSPLHRGLWVRRVLMCSTPPPPPPNIPQFEPAKENESEREAFARHAAPACAGCHNQMEPIGFGLSSFDGIGQFRESDSNDQPIDDTGFVMDNNGNSTPFKGPVELAALLSASPEVPHCMGTQLFRYTFASEEREEDACLIFNGVDAFTSSGNNFKALLRSFVASPAFGYRVAN